MGFEKLLGFLSRNLPYGCIEDVSINNSMRKVLANHVFFDLNFIIYHSVIELENEINDIFKIIYSLPFNYNNDIESKLNFIFEKKYWKNVNFTLENILDGNSEDEIVNNFKKFLESNNVKGYQYVFDILYWKIFFNIVNWIENFHDVEFIKTINIFLDGIPSYSKILEQRRRRSKNFLEANLRKKIFDDNFNIIENDIISENGISYNYFNWLNNKFSINKSIGPTSKMTIELELFLSTKLNNYFKNKIIYINSGTNYGESDNKIFKYIHEQKMSDDIVIHTCDSDLVHQIITQQCYFNINYKNVYLSVIRYNTKDKLMGQIIESKKIIKLLLKKYNEINKFKNVEKINYFNILDLMLILSFFGNDHLPSSLEIGCEISLNYYFSSHYNIFNDHGNVVKLKNGKLKLDIFVLSKWLNKIKNSTSLSLIILNRFYKLPYNLIHFLIDRLKLSIDNVIEEFFIPFYTYEGYYNIEVLKNNIEKEDLRYIFYKKFRNTSNEIPINPLDITSLPENFKKQYENIKLYLLKFIDFFDLENMGLQINNKIQLIDENSYQDLYKYILRQTSFESKELYKQFYKPYPYSIVKLKDYHKYLKKGNDEEYLRFLYYYVYVYMNDMTNFNPCNFIYFSNFIVPSLESIIDFINNSNINELYKKWDKYISDNSVDISNYFDSISHHLFITPYLKSSDYVDKIKNIPKLSIILNELEDKEGCLWFLDNDTNKKFNYKNIDPINFIKNWKEIINKINMDVDTCKDLKEDKIIEEEEENENDSIDKNEIILKIIEI